MFLELFEFGRLARMGQVACDADKVQWLRFDFAREFFDKVLEYDPSIGVGGGLHCIVNIANMEETHGSPSKVSLGPIATLRICHCRTSAIIGRI